LKHLFRAIFCTAITLASSASLAASQPPVRFVVPFAPGGATDIFARLLGQQLGQELDATVVVENKPGAGGSIGAASVAQAASDENTILLGTISTMAINPFIYDNLSYDPNADFTPIARVVELPNVLVVRADSDVRSVQDLVDKGKKDPQTYGSPGTGTTGSLTGELMKQMRPDFKVTHVPYRGSAPAVTDLMGGQIDFQFDNISALLPYIQSGKLRALAVSSTTPSAQLPDVRPMAEQGFPGYEVTSWFALYLPKGVSKDAVERYNGALARIFRKPEFLKQLEEKSFTPAYATGETFDAYVRSEQAKWREVTAKAGIKL
jgi:tripartite-type tricarboxylate transporter receptor subunit TctC